MRIALTWAGLALGIMGLGFGITAYDLGMFKFWAPKYENARREVFENTQSYVQGKIEYLGRLEREYKTAQGDEKAAIRGLILNEASMVDNNKLPVGLQAFIEGLK